MLLEHVTVWYSRNAGNLQAPWLIRGADGVTYRADGVTFFGATETRLLSDDERGRLPDNPRGVIEADLVRVSSAEALQ
jgi:hypothetical protein